MRTGPTLHLASSSPRRQEILRALGLSFSVQSVDIDESRHRDESPTQMVLRLATEKANAADMAADQVVIGGDTAVVLGERVLGKPCDREEGIEMLLSLSGRVHSVLTGVAVRSSAGIETAVSSTDVTFRQIDQDEANRYWQSGEPSDKAGGYGIQGLGGVFVVAINGSYSGVMGLPVFETVALLGAAGIEVMVKDQ